MVSRRGTSLPVFGDSVVVVVVSAINIHHDFVLKSFIYFPQTAYVPKYGIIC